MNENFTPNQNQYKNMTPFKYWLDNQIKTWGLNNFPFVESDFDELTNYGMLMKMMKAVNDVIANENLVEEDMSNLFTAFTQLQNYLFGEMENFETSVTNRVDSLETFMNNYFDNLDVQQEINNKLDDMAEDGTLTNLIKDYVDPIYQAYETRINNQLDTQNSRITNQNTEINVLKGRMDSFSSLVNGSTTGDAELEDIRVDFTGQSYSSAGNSTRGQIDFLNDKIDDIESYLKNHYQEGVLYNGTIANSGNTDYVHTRNKIPINGGEYIEIIIKDFTLNENEIFIYGWSLFDSTGTEVQRNAPSPTNTSNIIHVSSGASIKSVDVVIGVYNTSTEQNRAIRKTDFVPKQVQLKTTSYYFDNIEENFPYKLNDNIPSQQIYFGSGANYTLEKDSNNNIYFKFTGQLIFRVVYSNQFTCSQIIAMLGSEYTGTSPSGITDCIKIPTDYNLVLDYDDTTQRIKVLSRTNSTHTNTHLKIIENVNGSIIGGILKDIQNETNTKILLNNKLDNNRPSQQCYLMKDDDYIFETSGTDVYFHYSSMMLFRVDYSSGWSCADMATMVGETYSGTSPSGVQNCIIIPDSYDLVLDYTDSSQRIKVIPRTSAVNSNNYFRILESLGGEIVGGHLMYLFNNQKLKRNQVFDIYNIPDYWKNALDTAIGKVRTNIANLDGKIDSFFFITDQHWISNAQKSSDLIKYLGNKLQIPLVLSGGDVLNANVSTKLRAINEMSDYVASLDNGYIRLFETYGNHDNNNNINANPDNVLVTQQIYNTMIKQRETFTFDSPNIKVMKYDNSDSHIRYINFKCSWEYGETIDDDMINQVLSYISELDETWSVVLFCHTYWRDENLVYGVADYYVDKIATLEKTCDASIVAMFVGHVHDDYYTTYSASNGGKLLIISTTTDSFRQNNAVQNPPYTMTEGTDTEQAFDIVQIDRVGKHIYMTRIGAGNDRDFSY